MSIKAKPWEGGGAASVPDASETVKGIIRIATSAEATTGTDDTIAMTPLTVKERIDAAVTGGVQYKGTFNANTGTPSLANAEKGDLYVIGTAGSIYGQVWTEGDHLLINEDMGGTITNSKIDKVDNTDRVSSVNSMTGAVVISGNDVVADHTASNYTAANPQVDGHFSGVDTALGTKLSDITGESLDDLSDVSYTAGAGIDNYVLTYDHSTTSWGAEAVPSAPVTSVNSLTGAVTISGDDVAADHTATNYTAANANVDGHLSGIDTALGNKQPLDAGLTSISGLTTSADKMIYTTASDTYAVADLTSAGRALLDDADAAAQRTTLGLGTAATSASTDFLASTAGLDDLSDVSYTAGAGIDNYVLTYDHSTTSWGAEVVPSAPVTSVNSLTGAVTISGDDVAADHTASNYTAANANVDGHLSGIDTALGNKQPLDAGLTSISGLTTSADKMIYTTASDTYAVADLTSAGRALLDDADAAAQRTTLGLGTAATSASSDFLASTAGLDDLSDVSYTAGAGIDNYVLTYDHSTTSWGAEAVPSAPVTSVNSLTGAVTISGDDVAADHSATNYTAANANVDGHLSGIDTALGNKQPLDSGLTSISGLTTSADKMIYTTASDTYAVTDLTSAGRALLDDADASAQRTTLGLGTAATSASTDFLASTAGLNDLSDVTISSVSNGQVISYNSTSGEWENSTPASGGGQPNLTVVSSTSYTLSAANAPNIYIWYGASNSSTFTVTMPAIADVISDIASVGGSPAETFEVHIGRGQGGDITVSATNGIDLLGDGSVTYSTTQTINAGEWIKLIGWKVSASTARYLMNSPISQLTNLSDVTITSATSGNLLQHNGTAFVNVAKSTIDVGTFNDDGTYQPLDAGLTSISGLTTAADKMIYTTASDTYAVADLTSAGRALLDDADAAAQRTTLGLGTAATSASSDFLASTAGLNDLSDVSFTAGAGIDNYVLTYDHSTTSWGAEAAAGGGSSWTYSAITADPANAQAGYHYSCTGTFTITLPTSGVSAGEEIRVKNMGTGTITIDPQTQNIDGSTTDYVMDIQYSAITLVSTGTHWEII